MLTIIDIKTEKQEQQQQISNNQTNKNQDGSAALVPKLNRMGQSYFQEMKLLVFLSCGWAISHRNK